MSRVPQARAILQKVHDRLMERLCDLLIENEEELLGDEEWSGTQSELNEIAEKLRVASVTLGFMPNPEPQPTQPQGQVVVIAAMPTATLGDFLALVNEGEYKQAAAVLSVVLDISEERAELCTVHFIMKARTDSNTVNKFMRIPQVIRSPECEHLFSELFGLSQLESINIIKGLLSQ